MRCGHAADANLATTNPPTLCRYTGLQRPVSVNRAGPALAARGAVNWALALLRLATPTTLPT
jgi:hypothetical protein